MSATTRSPEVMEAALELLAAAVADPATKRTCLELESLREQVGPMMDNAFRRGFMAGNKAHDRSQAHAPALLSELEHAHIIIRHALAIMTTDQKAAWGRLNERAGIEGEGVTRANEREAVIQKARADA